MSNFALTEHSKITIMKRSHILGIAGLIALGCTVPRFAVWTQKGAFSSEVPATPVPSPTPLFPTHDLEELDRSVQAYFAVIPRDGNFGYSRIPTNDPIHASYHPATKEDQAIVSKLRDAKQDVVFFLVGRERSAARRFGSKRTKGPLFITSRFFDGSMRTAQDITQAQKEAENIRKSAPDGRQLPLLADTVFTQPKPDEGAQREMGDWKVIACPIEASSPECVTCHNNMAQAAAKSPGSLAPSAKPDLVSLHDPLGVALYCVRTMPQAAAQQTIPH